MTTGNHAPTGALDPRLSVPALPPRLVTRPRLLQALDHATGSAPLTLVTACPGGGKTVLLSDWASRRTNPTAWMALTRADNDLGQFWSLFIVAAGIAGPVPFKLSWDGVEVAGRLDFLFGAEREPRPSRVVVLDDAHLLRNPQILEGLDWVVRRWSHRVHLILLSRSVPLLPIHRYRLAGHLVELRDRDLAMTPTETQELLHVHGVQLSEQETDLLTARTEGWTAGLRLAALRMEVLDRPGEFVADLALDSGSVGEYLVEEVLSALPEDARRVLIGTSSLQDVTGAAAEGITGVVGSEKILADLARTNSFVVPVDPLHTTFRYHPLFREVLRHLARRDPPEVRRESHRRAAAWFEEQQDVLSALQWAIGGGDVAHARSLLVRGGLAEAFASGQDLRPVGLRDLVRAPATDGATEDEVAELALARLAVAALNDDAIVAAGHLELIRRGPPAARDDEPARDITRCLAEMLLAKQAAAWDLLDAAGARLLSEDLRPAVAAVHGLRSKVLLLQARTRYVAGQPAEVAPLLDRALAEAEHEHAFGVQLDILATQALASASAARPRSCEDTVSRALALFERHPELPPPTALYLAIARRAHVAADLVAMAGAMEAALAVSPLESDAQYAGAATYLQALLLRAGGQVAEARDWLNAPVLSTSKSGLLGVYRDCELAEIELSLGRPHQALEVLEPYQGTCFALQVAVPTAHARLALGEVAVASRLIRRVLTDPNPLVDRLVVVQAILCQAEIAVARGDQSAALENLERAMDLAGEDVVIPFLTVTPVVAPLLARHPVLAARWPDPALLPAVLLVDGLERPREGPAEPLTEREKAVLRLLTTTMSMMDVADELCLSINTVKTHIAAIYRKIGVAKRREAVQRARELELL